MSYPFTNLVFEGGGVKGIAYAGAIEALDEKGVLDQIERVAGTSAGAITSALVSLRYSATEVRDIISNTDFKSFKDHWDPLRIPTKYGLYKGNAFLDWIKDHITQKGLAGDATFQDFKHAGCRDLKVFATDLNEENAKEFSVDTHPNVSVAEAVRASMSIPLFFMGWKFTDDNPDDHVYVDGGTVFNYPLTVFDEGKPNMATLGFHLDNLSGEQKPNNLDYDELLHYVKFLFNTLLRAQVIDFNEDPDQVKRTVRIDDFGISATDFDLTDAQKEQLYQSGKKATLDYLSQFTN